jgi:hypothetical protein
MNAQHVWELVTALGYSMENGAMSHRNPRVLAALEQVWCFLKWRW